MHFGEGRFQLHKREHVSSPHSCRYPRAIPVPRDIDHIPVPPHAGPAWISSGPGPSSWVPATTNLRLDREGIRQLDLAMPAEIGSNACPQPGRTPAKAEHTPTVTLDVAGLGADA